VVSIGMADIELNVIAPSFDDRPDMPEYGAHSVIWVSPQNDPKGITAVKRSIKINKAIFFIS